MERRNQKTKSVGNGEGTLYKSKALDCWVFQYYDTNNKRQTIKQRKNESAKDFKVRVTEIKNSLNNGTYIQKRNDTLKTILLEHVNQKFKDGIIQGNTYIRDKETLQQIEKCCPNLTSKPIQKITLFDIQNDKENMKKYKQSGIDRMWRFLKKGFAIASSPSVKLITYNIMNDENLKKPISNYKTRVIKPLTPSERKKLEHVLDNEERNHKYRNIVKMEWLTSMRIGEVLARSIDDISSDKSTFHIHNTLTKDKNGNIIIGKHTKTYNPETGIDEGERYFPTSKELIEIFNELLSNKILNIHKLLFWDYEKNTFITYNEVNSWLERINQKYKICDGKLHNHRLRHDRLTQWIESGMDIRAVQYLAGHIEGSDVTDNVYIDISREYAFKEYEKAK